MTRSIFFTICFIIGLLLISISPPPGADLPPNPKSIELEEELSFPVRFKVDTTLPDVAFSYPDDKIIVINPKMLTHLPSGLAGFSLNHEIAHIVLKHRRATIGDPVFEEQQELDADCFAASFAVSSPAQRKDAIEFFRRRSRPFDLQRANVIEKCSN